MALRPTNEDCLMRIVTTPDFCSVCKEGLWLRLLSRVTLADGFATSCTPSGKRRLRIDLVPLAQFRDGDDQQMLKERGVQEKYSTRWFKDDVEREEWKDQIEVVDADDIGYWRVEIVFESSEIRKDEGGYSMTSAGWVIKSGCDEA
jgi:hypothetical protein